MSNIKIDCVERIEIDEIEIDDEVIFDAIREDYFPEDVFTMETLDTWATENGYVKEETP